MNSNPSSSDRHDPGFLDISAFALAGLGLNITFAIYLAYVKVYGEAFSRNILGWMNLCIYTAATSVVLAQIYLDSMFDRKYDTKTTYTFRICIGLFVMFLTLMCVPFAISIYHVYAVGVLIGLFEGSGLSTLQQLAAATHRDLSKYANTGFTVAQVLPILLSFLLGFYEARAGSFAAIAFAWIPAGLCLLATALFLGLVLRGRFDQAFDRMDELLSRERKSEPNSPLDRNHERAALAGRFGDSQSEQTLWLRTPIAMCASVQFVTNGLSIFLMPFLTYFGSSSLAHILVLVRFGSELAGRVIAHLVSLENCKAFTAILILVVATIARAVMLILVLLDVFGFWDLGTMWLFILVGGFYLLFGWTQSEVMTTIVDVGPPGRDTELMRGMMLLCFAAQLISLAIALIIVELHLEQNV